jgi:hypothetical protein
LAQHKGDLFLSGLTMLSGEATAALQANPEINLPDRSKR